MVEFLQKKGIEEGLIDIGGEIKGFGNKIWHVGIQDPRVTDSKGNPLPPIGVIGIQNIAVATSGHYFRYYEIAGKKYSHIVDPRTGYPVEWKILSATVICESAMLADAYATALCVLSVEESMKLAQKQNFEIFLIVNENENIQFKSTPGFQKYWLEKP
jgi:thiamine biosynthesis lipoprotein